MACIKESMRCRLMQSDISFMSAMQYQKIIIVNF